MPMEVMGLMLGQFVDDYTINCVDAKHSVFSCYMPYEFILIHCK